MMTHAELLAELLKRKALIVHCSRLGKDDKEADKHLFPNDLQNAINVLRNGSEERSCSVIWPEHIETFGPVGIIVKPRSTKSISSICTIDGGTYPDQETGKLEGAGVPFSEQTVKDTFYKATDYNEWVLKDADTIGIFIHPQERSEVAKKILRSEIPGYDPLMGDGEEIMPLPISLEDIAKQFPNLPIYSFSGPDIVRIDGTGQVIVNPVNLYL